jgi:hypothetical protein
VCRSGRPADRPARGPGMQDDDEEDHDGDSGGHGEGSHSFHGDRYCAEMGVVADSGLTRRAARMYQAVVPVCSEA